MINGTCRTIVSNSALGIFDNPIGSELTQPRANIAGRYTQALGNFLCREAVGRAPQDLEGCDPEVPSLYFPKSGPLQQGH